MPDDAGTRSRARWRFVPLVLLVVVTSVVVAVSVSSHAALAPLLTGMGPSGYEGPVAFVRSLPGHAVCTDGPNELECATITAVAWTRREGLEVPSRVVAQIVNRDAHARRVSFSGGATSVVAEAERYGATDALSVRVLPGSCRGATLSTVSIPAGGRLGVCLSVGAFARRLTGYLRDERWGGAVSVRLGGLAEWWDVLDPRVGSSRASYLWGAQAQSPVLDAYPAPGTGATVQLVDWPADQWSTGLSLLTYGIDGRALFAPSRQPPYGYTPIPTPSDGAIVLKVTQARRNGHAIPTALIASATFLDVQFACNRTGCSVGRYGADRALPTRAVPGCARAACVAFATPRGARVVAVGVVFNDFVGFDTGQTTAWGSGLLFTL